jgi:hypothetical protein
MLWKRVSMKGFTYLDEYDFRARFVPSIITTLPIITAIIALFPPARQLYGLLIGPALELVLVLMLVRVARDEGKRIEPRLIKQRDGLPTTRYLRNRNDELSEPYTLDAVQRRAALSRRRRRPIFIAPKI